MQKRADGRTSSWKAQPSASGPDSGKSKRGPWMTTVPLIGFATNPLPSSQPVGRHLPAARRHHACRNLAPDQRRLLNQAFFEKLYVFEDRITDAIFNPPFDELLQI